MMAVEFQAAGVASEVDLWRDGNMYIIIVG